MHDSKLVSGYRFPSDHYWHCYNYFSDEISIEKIANFWISIGFVIHNSSSSYFLQEFRSSFCYCTRVKKYLKYVSKFNDNNENFRDLRNQLTPATTNYFDYDTPTHMNTGNYIIGILIGVLYHKYEDIFIKLKKSFKLEVFWHFTWIAGLSISIFGFPYLEHNVEKSFLTAIFGGIMKHYHGVLLGATMFGLIFKFSRIVSNFCDSSIFRVFGKICYSYLVCHLVLIKYFTASAVQMPAITEQYMVRIIY